MIVGAQKAGTTSLYHYLLQHDGVIGHATAEMTFFQNEHESEKGYDNGYQRYFGEVDDGKSAILAKHAMLMYSRAGLTRLKEEAPDTKVAVILREPVSRAESAYWYAVRRGWEPSQTFAEALALENERLRGDGWGKWRDCAYFNNGDYASHIDTLWQIFGRDAVTIILLDDFVRDPTTVCAPLRDILAVAEMPLPTVAPRQNTAAMPRSRVASRLLAGIYKSRHPAKFWLRKLFSDRMAMRIRKRLWSISDKQSVLPQTDPECRRVLKTQFSPTVDRLEKMLGRAIDVWR